MEKKEPNINNDKKKKKYGKSFYVIFALCMVAMVGAAWSAYSSVSNYMEPSIIETNPTSSTKKSDSNNTTNATDADSATEATQPDAENVANQMDSTLPTDAATQPETETETKANEDAYFYPMGDEVLKEYSGVTPVKSKTFGDYRTHNGTDYKGKEGASVHMVTTGTVQGIKTDEIMGGIVITENNDGSVVTYCGVKPSDGLKIGSHLSAGDVIGTLAKIPGEEKDGAHLHIEISQDGKPLNPEEFLNNHSAH